MHVNPTLEAQSTRAKHSKQRHDAQQRSKTELPREDSADSQTLGGVDAEHQDSAACNNIGY
jgi:hypothetical protein